MAALVRASKAQKALSPLDAARVAEGSLQGLRRRGFMRQRARHAPTVAPMRNLSGDGRPRLAHHLPRGCRSSGAPWPNRLSNSTPWANSSAVSGLQQASADKPPQIICRVHLARIVVLTPAIEHGWCFSFGQLSRSGHYWVAFSFFSSAHAVSGGSVSSSVFGKSTREYP
jgi:hypothetical protein